MKFVAIYNSETGEITALCALPQDADAPTVGMQMGPGESRAQFEVPEELAVKSDYAQPHARMEKIIKDYRIKDTGEVKLVKASGSSKKRS